MANNVEDTLKQRGEVYGDYKGGSEFRANVVKLIEQRYYEVHGEPLDRVHLVYVYDIVNKLSRLCVTPKHIDTWHDIAGYARLVEDVLILDEKAKK